MNINELHQYTVFREKTPYGVHNGLIVKIFLNGVSHFAIFAYLAIEGSGNLGRLGCAERKGGLTGLGNKGNWKAENFVITRYVTFQNTLKYK